MKKIVLGLVFVASSLMATTYTPNGTMKMGWTAFKTPAKKAVNGTFNTVMVATPTKNKSIESLLNHSSVMIDTKSVNSNNEGRDKKLTTFFFGLLNQKTISAHIGAANDGKMVLWLTFNGLTKKVEMTYNYENGMIEGKGTISLASFSATKALHSITKACYDLHKGVTWDDVSIWFSMPVSKQ